MSRIPSAPTEGKVAATSISPRLRGRTAPSSTVSNPHCAVESVEWDFVFQSSPLEVQNEPNDHVEENTNSLLSRLTCKKGNTLSLLPLMSGDGKPAAPPPTKRATRPSTEKWLRIGKSYELEELIEILKRGDSSSNSTNFKTSSNSRGITGSQTRLVGRGAERSPSDHPLEQSEDKLQFLHVTPRFNLFNERRPNFYDLVIIGVPGYESMMRMDHSRQAFTSHQRKSQIDPWKVMQLSLQGLLYSEEPDGVSILLPLDKLQREKNLFLALQKLSFFRCFKILKVFKAWRVMTRRRRILEASQRLQSDHFFSHEPLVKASYLISEQLYMVEQDLELFAFHGLGCINVSEFISLQIEKFHSIRPTLRRRIICLGNLVTYCYHEAINHESHLNHIHSVLKHHPFAHAEESGVDVDWIAVRAIGRIHDNCRQKAEAILRMGQYRLEAMLAKILSKFWKRFRKILCGGVESVFRRHHNGVLGYWPLDIADCNVSPDTPLTTPSQVEPLAVISDVAKTIGEELLDISGEELMKGGLKGIVEATTRRHQQRSLLQSFDPTLPLNSKLVSKEWLKQGAHVCVDIALFYKGNLAGSNEENGKRRSASFVQADSALLPENLSELKVRILPENKSLMDQVHELYGAISDLLESVPNLRKHPLVNEEKRGHVAKIEEDELTEEMTPVSKGYFTKMHLYPILNSEGGLSDAVRCLHSIVSLHNSACHVELRTAKLQEAVRKLCSLNVEGLVKQLQLSLILPILKNSLLGTLAVEPSVSIAREKSKLASLDKIIHYLEQSKLFDQYFQEILLDGGFVVSFSFANSQLSVIREVQRSRLFGKLPSVFMTRCKALTEYLKSVEVFFSIDQFGFSLTQIALLKKLKTFESSIEMYTLEVDICNSIYEIIQGKYSSVAAIQSAVDSTADIPRTRNSAGSTLEAMFKEYNDKRAAISSTVNSGKMLLLGQLHALKRDCFVQRQELHDRIRLQVLELQRPLYTDGVLKEEVLEGLKACQMEVSHIRKAVADMISTQSVLLEAHDLVGVAEVVLKESEVDRYPDMEALEELLEFQLITWRSISSTVDLERSLRTTRLGYCDVKSTAEKLNEMRSSLDSLLSNNAKKSQNSLRLLSELFDSVQPIVSIVAFLTSKAMRLRHFRWLDGNCFAPCGLSLRMVGPTVDSIVITETNNKSVLGGFFRTTVETLISRGIIQHLGKIHNISTIATIEYMLELTLDQIDGTLKCATVSLSMDWLRECKLREKIFFELFQATNLTQLNVLLSYCKKSILIIEQISVDMSSSTFVGRISLTKTFVERLTKFVERLRDFQFKWMYLFHYVKFASPGELDRDATRTFQSCTEELKRIELVFQQKSSNLCQAYAVLAENESSIESANINLSLLMEDAHSNIQSLLDACPRISMLPYTRIHRLMKAWKLGPHLQIELVTECLRSMFEGVGSIFVEFNVSKRTHYCCGFLSVDSAESINFLENVPLSLDLASFVTQFEIALKSVLVRSSDALMLKRIDSLKLLVAGVPTEKVVASIENVFSQRLSLVFLAGCDAFPNQCFVLVNYCAFAEDVWTALGYPSGSLCLAKNVLSVANSSFSPLWKSSLQKIAADCKANADTLLRFIQKPDNSFKMKRKKALALCSSLFIQEVAFLRIVEEICCHESYECACEYWAGRYHVRFVYNKDERSFDVPFEIQLGCMTVIYGMEYFGAFVKVVGDSQTELGLQKVISGAFSLSATVLVCKENSTTSSFGEYAISCQDLACALGRQCITMLDAENSSSVRLFLARLTYLDAVGCIDFTSLSIYGLQNVSSVLASFWKSMEEKNDVYLQDSLKFPLKTKYSGTELQHNRRKENLIRIRSRITQLKTVRKFTGIILVAVASETRFSDHAVMSNLAQSNFQVISVSSYCPVQHVGLMLSIEGFHFALELQRVLERTLQALKVRFHSSTSVFRLSSSMMLHALCHQCGRLLCIRLEKEDSSVRLPTESRLKVEFETVALVFWENVLIFGEQLVDSVEEMRKLCIYSFQERLDEITKESLEKVSLENRVRHTKYIIPVTIERIIRHAATKLGFWSGYCFAEQCSSFWSLLTQKTNSVVILVGDASSGKTALRKSVVEVIRRVGSYPDLPHSNIGPIMLWRAAFIIAESVIRWYNQLKVSKDRKSRRDEIIEENQVHSDEDEPTSGNPPVAGDSLSSSFELCRTRIDVSVIYHASLSSSAFLGEFDGNGRWNDGILIRKLRATEEEKRESGISFVVLDGPMGYYAELIFGSNGCRGSRSVYSKAPISHNTLVLPSGEFFSLNDRIKIIFETNDVSNASPSFLVSFPQLHLKVSAQTSASRLLIVWVRSITNWLSRFRPWKAALDEITEVLLRSEFVNELMMFNAPTNVASVLTCSLAVSKLSSFLRLVEELLWECHDLALEEAIFVKVEANEFLGDEFDGPTERLVDTDQMELDDKNTNVLLRRVRYSLIYSAIWGFGGAMSSASSRIYFETLIRDLAFKFFGDDVELPSSSSVFEMVLSLRGMRMTLAVPIRSKQSDKALFDVPKRFEDFHIVPELLCRDEADFDFHGGKNRLIFRLPSHFAVKTALKYLLQSGANLLLTGPKSSGKTALLLEILSEFGVNVASPAQLREYIDKNLLDIIAERRRPEGIDLVVEVLKAGLKSLQHDSPLPDSSTTFASRWEGIKQTLKPLWEGGVRKHCKAKTIFSCYASFRMFGSSDQLRDWVAKELASEIEGCLEVPRCSHGVIFLDDIHVCTEKSDSRRSRMAANMPESLLKGILGATTSFGVMKNLSVLSSTTVNQHGDSRNSMLREIEEPPILHKSFLSDPRSFLGHQDDFIFQNVSVVSAATGTIEELSKATTFAPNVQHFCGLFLPELTISQLHACLISGAYVCLNRGDEEHNVVETFRSEVVELSNFTMIFCRKMISSVDELVTTPLEKELRCYLNLNIGLVANFCKYLILGSRSVSDPGGLLQLFAHEWKRLFLDPVPDGAQRERFITMILSSMESIDCHHWCISRDWLSSLEESFNCATDPVWISSAAFDASAHLTEEDMYAPMEYLEQDFSEEWPQTCIPINSDCEALRAGVLFYPGAICMVLKLVRALTTVKKHIHICGYFGENRSHAVQLASLICRFHFVKFSVVGLRETGETVPSEFSKRKISLRLFLKSAILSAAGLESLATDGSCNFYALSAPQKVVVSIEHSQNMNEAERRMLLALLDYNDPTFVFDEEDILGDQFLP